MLWKTLAAVLQVVEFSDIPGSFGTKKVAKCYWLRSTALQKLG
jgi:hypothetical protein